MIGEKIKKAREAAGLTQQQVHDLMLIPINTLSAWECGRRITPAWASRFILNELAKIKQENTCQLDKKRVK